ncbi:tumor necrosis factor receptor superfamily member 1A [Eucyclogobius newberryi]|uniref:tumor necrosis factor receptor superfamily member 1A n=1 Tax=Eucyclogobius newberryi TaxID=166745 RepID=UPI003B5B5114
MAMSGNSGRLIVSRALFLGIGLLLSLSVSAAVTNTCPGGEYLTDAKICCKRCAKGYKLLEHCSASGHSSNCTRCPSGQFMDQMNYDRNCRSCRRCKEGIFERQVAPCESDKDTICQCNNGRYKYNIDKYTYECRLCSTCKDGEEEVAKCTLESNTACGCKENYYKEKNKCLPCANCVSDCSDSCPSKATTKDPPPDTSSFLINVIAGVVVVGVFALVLVVLVTHFVTKRQTKRKLLSSSHFKEASHIYQEVSGGCEEALNQSVPSHSEPFHIVLNQEPSNLPDCVPPEIKMSEVIYSLLELVPVLQVKQLVRSLGVSDSVIERAELDHRSSKEAHYQMLRAWAEQGAHTGRGHGGVLHLPQLQELLDKLRLMHLEQTAQELETQYSLL